MALWTSTKGIPRMALKIVQTRCIIIDAPPCSSKGEGAEPRGEARRRGAKPDPTGANPTGADPARRGREGKEGGSKATTKIEIPNWFATISNHSQHTAIRHHNLLQVVVVVV